jgi:uncharacterized protein (TIGR04255 family)
LGSHDEVALTFERPPVVEVATAVSFERLPATASVHFGAFWAAVLADEFPQVQELAPHIPQIERFGQPVLAPELPLTFTQEFPSRRFWFVNNSGEELLQLQPDWLAANWRKVSPDAKYGKWASRRKTFERFYSRLDAYLSQVGVGHLEPRQCELTYINHIVPGIVLADQSDFEKVLNIVRSVELGPRIRPERVEIGQHYVISDEQERPIGRLHIVVRPGYLDQNKTPIYQLELTARGAPNTPDLDGTLSFFDRSHDIISQAFTEVTTNEVLAEWGIHESNR